VEIIDNFLPEDQFNIIRKTMFDEWDFAWFFTPGQSYVGQPDRFMFNHVIVSMERGINSHHFDMFDPVLKKLGAYRLYRMKANLTLRTDEHEAGGFHVDGFDKDFGYPDTALTAVYYINTCNGYTEFKTGEKVKSVANRMLIFNSELEHQGVSSTDELRRVLINFNYNEE
tara:strand:- start:542 stop:1051 length:510 start_codon:yes stop_codon:yes gene_type:complete